MRSATLPHVDTAALSRVVRRTAVTRALVVAALAGALALGVLAASDPYVGSVDLLPTGTSGIVVLDASASVEGSSRIADLLPDVYENPNRRIGAALRTLVERDEPVGVVLFSDVAYEMLPPRSPAHALAPLQRFFGLPAEPSVGTGAGSAVLEVNPWTQSFSGGTQISAGLSEALEILERDGVRDGSILLLSDLDAPDDPNLAAVLGRIRDSGVPLRIVPLVLDPERQVVFARAFGDDVFVDPGELDRVAAGAPQPEAEGGAFEAAFPAAILLAGVAVLLLLGVHERLFVRLPLPERGAAG